jgi:hypothetical protein
VTTTKTFHEVGTTKKGGGPKKRGGTGRQKHRSLLHSPMHPNTIQNPIENPLINAVKVISLKKPALIKHCRYLFLYASPQVFAKAFSVSLESEMGRPLD